MGSELSRYLERQLQLAIDGELPPSCRTAEVEEMQDALKALFSEGLSAESRERLFIRLGLVGLSALVQRHRASLIVACAESRYRRQATS